jgi:hypothetical protein
MRTYFDCVPCFLRQALDAARLVSDREAVHEAVLRQTLQDVAAMDLSESPPAMGQRIHRTIRRVTGDPDPYREIKARFNRLALRLLPRFREEVARAAAPFSAAVKLSIAGNLIDFGPRSDLQEAEVAAAIEQALDAPLSGDVEGLQRAVERAGSILWLADNAGEIVFDRLLLERLPTARTVVAVRGHPTINDATLEDARAAGLDQLVTVIDNGSDAPATLLPDTPPAFRERFARADLVIAKGQGNYEALSEARAGIVFLLRAKCPVIARDLGCEVGQAILRLSGS